jgi:biotin-dependent carboxylase-like uncharacterized protein
LSFRVANLLVGNEPFAPVLEMTLLGATFEFHSNADVALSGAACECVLGKEPLARNSLVRVEAGSVLQCGSITSGARLYLAVRGGIGVPLVMGSASTDLRGTFGGLEGRRLKAGDFLPVGNVAERRSRSLLKNALDRLRLAGPIRVTRGAQADWFTNNEFQKFLTSAYRISEQSDRAGLRLIGDAIKPRYQRQLLTDGIPLGAIQVPQDGQPIILFVDQQTTGGYPKIANIIAADMHRVGQMCPRAEVRFEEVSLTDAIQALREQEQWLQTIWQE